MPPSSDEVWLPAVGYVGWYDVSSWGQVRRHQGGRVLTPYRSRSYGGQRAVSLSVDGVSVRVRVATLVVATFFRPCWPIRVTYLDGDRENVRADNLAVVPIVTTRWPQKNIVYVDPLPPELFDALHRELSIQIGEIVRAENSNSHAHQK